VSGSLRLCDQLTLLRLEYPQLCSLSQYVTLHKYFSHPSLVFSFYLWTTSPIKLKVRLQIGKRLLITNHLDQSLLYDWSIRNREHQSDHIYYALLSKLHGSNKVVPFVTSLGKLYRNAEPKSQLLLTQASMF